MGFQYLLKAKGYFLDQGASVYRIGFCPQCGTQIMVQDVDGKWNSVKPNFRQADLTFSTGQKSRTIICDTCLATPDLTTIYNSIIDPNSQAGSKQTMDILVDLGAPVSIEEWRG